jgi:hypothetical protein
MIYIISAKFGFNLRRFIFFSNLSEPLPEQSLILPDNVRLSRTKSGWPRQCPTGCLCPSSSLWHKFFLSLALNSFSKSSYAIMCRCQSRERQAGWCHVMIPPPAIAQAEMMTLRLPHTQGGQQRKLLGEVMQVPPKLMRKLQMWSRARLSEKQELVT